MTKLNSKQLKELLAIVEAEENKPKVPKKVTKNTLKKQEKVFTFIKDKGEVTLPELHEFLGGAQSNIFNYLNRLRTEGRVFRVAGSNPVRYSVDKSVTSPVHPTVNRSYAEHAEAILEFASKHVGECFSVNEMGRILSIPMGSVSNVVADLKKRKLLADDFNRGANPFTGTPTATPVTETIPTPAVVEDQQKPAQDPFITQVDFLAWRFVKETGSVDLLAFLRSLEGGVN